MGGDVFAPNVDFCDPCLSGALRAVLTLSFTDLVGGATILEGVTAQMIYNGNWFEVIEWNFNKYIGMGPNGRVSIAGLLRWVHLDEPGNIPTLYFFMSSTYNNPNQGYGGLVGENITNNIVCIPLMEIFNSTQGPNAAYNSSMFGPDSSFTAVITQSLPAP
jgi:hypothetical protein